MRDNDRMNAPHSRPSIETQLSFKTCVPHSIIESEIVVKITLNRHRGRRLTAVTQAH